MSSSGAGALRGLLDRSGLLVRPLLDDRRHRGVGECPKRRRRHREDGRIRPGGRPHEREPSEVGVHDHPKLLRVTDRRDAADDESGEIVGLAGARPADALIADDRREASQIDAVRPGDEAEDRLERPVLRRRHEDERLDDLAEFGAHRRSGIRGRVRRLGEDVDVERHALAGGGVEDTLGRGMDVGAGHEPESSMRSVPLRPTLSLLRPTPGRPVAILGRSGGRPSPSYDAAVDERRIPGRVRDGLLAIVVADGDVPDRASLDAAWPGWADAASFVVAADGGARGAERLGLRIDLIVGDGDSLGSVDLDRFAAAGVPIRRAPADKDESDTELAVAAAIEAGADRLVIVGAIGGRRFDHALANIGLLAHPALLGHDTSIVDVATRITLLSGPARRRFAGRAGDLVSLLPFSDDVTGVTTEGLRYSLAGEPLALGPARGLSNVRDLGMAIVDVRAGRLLVVESPATLDR